MATTSSSSNPNLVGQVVAEWRERLLRGERFEVHEYTTKYPALADELRELFSAIVVLEELKGQTKDVTGSPGAGAPLAEGKPLERLGDYRILREIGRGGMGIVYEAEQESLGRHVALKVLPAQSLLDPHKQKRFQREAKAAARLHHTNIVPVYGVGEHEGMHYYVMQFIQGLGLDDVLVELKRLHEAKGVPQGRRTVKGLQSLSEGAKDLSAVDVAQSLLSGQFGQPPAVTAAASSAGENEPYAVTATRIVRPEEPDAAGPAPPTEPAEARRGAQGVDWAPPKSAASASPSGSTSVSSSVILPGQTETTLTESGRHYWQSVARIGIQVADALDYAQSQGILHRDIKPSNLLLDTQGTVWVTDFGLAKATEDVDNLTHTGDIVGTIRYMAPERFNGISDIRSDIYSIGLTLYQLITQRPAFEERDRNKLIKLITDGAPRLPRQLDPSIPRDLETIVLKAIDREPGRRYQTARALAEDLKRFVDDKPIQARQASAAERLWRWCRRNPMVASLSAAILTLLAIVAVASTVVAMRFERLAAEESQLRRVADEARSRAEVARNEAEISLQEAQHQKHLAENNLQEVQRQKQLAEANLQEAQRQKHLAEENFRQARMAVDDSLTKISESKLLHVEGLQPLRKELLESALKYYQGFLNQRADDPMVRKDLATAYTRMAKITAEISSKDKALEAYQQALALRKQLWEREPGSLDLQADLAYHHQAIGRLQQELGNLDAALKALQEASNLLRTVIPQTQEKLELLSAFANLYTDIGTVYILKNEPLEAMSYYTAALKFQRQLVDENRAHPKIVQLQYALASQLNQMGSLHEEINLFTEASKLHSEALGILKELVSAHPGHDQLHNWQRALAGCYESMGKVHSRSQQETAALQAYQDALLIREKLANANPAVTDYQSDLANAHFTLGLLQAKMGQLAAAVDSYQRAIERQRLVVLVAPGVAEYRRQLGQPLARLGGAQKKLGQVREALHSYREAGAILEALPQPTASDLYELACARAACSLLVGQGKAEFTPPELTQRQQDADRALAALRQAVAADYRELERVEKDPELEVLRSRPDFQAVVGELRAKVKVPVWHEDFEAAKAQAAKDKKDLFIYFTGSDWCSWCLLVRRDVFGKDAFIDYVSQHFVLVELDFPHHKAKPKNFAQNQELFRRWGLKGYPSLILADAQGRPYANLRDGQVRDDASAYVTRMEKLRQVRVARDELLTQALALEGLDKARYLDKALRLLPQDFRGGYHDAIAQICTLDSLDQAGLRSQYISLLMGKQRSDIQEAMKRQDWDGTILKIDKIIEELKPTGQVAAEMWLNRARALMKLREWAEAEADLAKALELKPGDADVRLERGQLYQESGQVDKAVVEFNTAIEAKAKAVATAREVFVRARHVQTNRLALNSAYRALAIAQRKAGRPADAVATSLDRARLWPGYYLELYNVACDLALCVPIVGQDQERTAAEKAQRRQYADQAMEMLRAAILLGWNDVAHMKRDRDLDALRARDDFKELMRQLEQPNAFATALESRVLKGHTHNLVEAVAVAPDGRRVVSSANDNTVRLWDTETGREIRRFEGHTGWVRSLAFSADGRRLVTGGNDDGTVRLWDVESGQELRRFLGHHRAVAGVAISPDGTQLLSGGVDKTLRLWEAETGKEIRRLEGPTPLPILGASIVGILGASPGARPLLAVSALIPGRTEPTAAVLAVAFAADGRHALSGGSEPIVYYWDVQTGKAHHRLEVPQDSVSSVALSQDGRRAAVGTRSGFVYLWDLESGRPLHRLEGDWNLVRAVGFTPDGRRIVSANTRRGMILHDVETGHELYRFGQTLACGGLAIAPHGRWVATVNADSKVHLWTLSEETLRARELAHWGQLDQATVAYNQAVERQPGDVDLRIERGRFHARQRQWELALADYTLALQGRPEDADLWVERGRCFVELGAWDKVAADFDKALTSLAGDRNAPVRRGEIDLQVVQQDKAFTELVALRPKDAQLWLARGRFFARRTQWPEAAVALAKSIELQPPGDPAVWFEHACLQLLTGDVEGYRGTCTQLLERFHKKDGAQRGYLVARACTLAPNGVADAPRLAQLVEPELAKNRTAYGSLVEQAALRYRAGQFEQALPPLRDGLKDSVDGDGTVVGWLWLAMARQQLGQANEAQQALDKAEQWFGKYGKAMPSRLEGTIRLSLHDWLEAHLLRQEADRLIKGIAGTSHE